jgi:multiple sugar transport system permease protein
MYDTAFRRIDPSYATVVAIAAAVMSFSLVIVIRRIFEREVALV